MKITEEQEVAERYGLKGPMDRIRQKAKGERAYTNDEIAEHEHLAAEIRAKLDDYQPERMRAALAALSGGAQSSRPVTDLTAAELDQFARDAFREAAQQADTPPAWLDEVALQLAHEIFALPENWTFARRKAAAQTAIVRKLLAVSEGHHSPPQPIAASVVEALEAGLRNMLGAYDTPVSRRRFPPDDFMKEATQSARDALAALTAARDTEGK